MIYVPIGDMNLVRRLHVKENTVQDSRIALDQAAQPREQHSTGTAQLIIIAESERFKDTMKKRQVPEPRTTPQHPRLQNN